MKLITFQHRNILHDLCVFGKYECNYFSKYHKSTPKAYNKLLERLHMNKSISPIFGWQKITDEPLTINEEQICNALYKTGFNEKEYFLFELEVPEGFYDLQNFYNFVDMRCLEEGIDVESITTTWEDVFNIVPTLEIQVTMPFIDASWVKNIYTWCWDTKDNLELKLVSTRYLNVF